MKKNALIIPANIRSHVLPSLYLADLLADDYNIHYEVVNGVTDEIVKANGYNTILSSDLRIGYGMEASLMTEQKQNFSFWKFLNLYRNNEVYKRRKSELDKIINTLKPSIVIIDLFSCTDFWALYPRHQEFKLLFFNPMPSTYRVKGFPIVSDGHWLKDEKISVAKSHELKFKHWVQNPKKALIQWVAAKQHPDLQSIAPDYPIATDRTVTLIIANVPELLLAPINFEFSPAICKPNQYYLGLCQRENRKDTELDADFNEKWALITQQKQAGKRIIYCSFGTYYEGPDRKLLDFITLLLDTIQSIPDVVLVCSVNRFVIEFINAQFKNLDSVLLFTRVPQMQVLSVADLFITHGGFGSIKEAIYYEVPMLVYPLDLNYDQNGNGLKVAYHGLGLRGVFGFERPNDMKNKIMQLLNNEDFKTKIRLFNQLATQQYTVKKLKETLNSLLT